MDEKNLKSLYDFVVANKLDIGDYDSFKKGLEKPENRKSFHEFVTSNKLDIGGYDEFESNWSLKKKEPTVPTDGSGIQEVTIPSESPSPNGTLGLPNRSVNTEPTLEASPPPVNAQADTPVQQGAEVKEGGVTPPNLAQIQLENIMSGNSTPFMEFEKPTADNTFDYVITQGVNNSLIGKAYQAAKGRPMANLDISTYQPTITEEIGAGLTSLIIDLPAFGPGGSVGGAIGKAGVNVTVGLITKGVVKEGIKRGLAEEVIKKAVANSAKRILASKGTQLTMAASHSAGALGMYDAASDFLGQLAEGKDVYDVDYGQTLKALGKGAALGTVVGGLGYGTAIARKAVSQTLSGTAAKIAKAGVDVAGFGAENAAFVTGSQMLQGKPLDEITGKDWVMSFATLGGLKGVNKIRKFVKSNSFTKDQVNVGEFNVEFTPEERRAISRIGYDKDTDIFDNAEKIIADPTVPQTAKMKLGWATEGIRLETMPNVDGVFMTEVDGKWNVSSTNKAGEIVSSVDYPTREDADAAAIEAYQLIKDAKVQENINNLAPQQKADVLEKLKLMRVEPEKVEAAMDKHPAERSPEEIMLVNQVADVLPPPPPNLVSDGNGNLTEIKPVPTEPMPVKEETSDISGMKPFTKEEGNTVVDDAGKPITLYHGTVDGGFGEFNPSNAKENRAGIFFTDNPKVAESYSGSPETLSGSSEYFNKSAELDKLAGEYSNKNPYNEKNVGSALLGEAYKYFREYENAKEQQTYQNISFQNIVDITGSKKLAKEFLSKYEKLEKAENNTKSGVYQSNVMLKNPMVVDFKGKDWNNGLFEGKRVSTNDITNIAIKRGYDGVIFKNIVDIGKNAKLKTKSDKISNIYVVFDKNNIRMLDKPSSPKSEVKNPWEMKRSEWEQTAKQGTIRQGTGKFTPEEEALKTPLAIGEYNKYNPQDIAHWYEKRYGTEGYQHYIKDAINEGRNVPDAVIEEVFSDKAIPKWKAIRDKNQATPTEAGKTSEVATPKQPTEIKSTKDVGRIFDKLLKDEHGTKDYGIHGLINDWNGAYYDKYNDKLVFVDTRSGTGKWKLSKKEFINWILSGKAEEEIPDIKDYISKVKETIYKELGVQNPEPVRQETGKASTPKPTTNEKTKGQADKEGMLSQPADNATNPTPQAKTEGEGVSEKVPKHIAELYIERTTLEATANALRQQMRGNKLTGKAKSEYDKVTSRINELNSKIADFENSIPVGNQEAISQPEVKETTIVESKPEISDPYGSFLMDKVEKSHLSKYPNETNVVSAVAKEWNRINEENGTIRANSYLEDMVTANTPKDERVGLSARLRNEYKSTTSPVTPEQVKVKAAEAQNPNVPLKEQKKDLLGQIDEAIDIVLGDKKVEFDEKKKTNSGDNVFPEYIDDATVKKLRSAGFNVKETVTERKSDKYDHETGRRSEEIIKETSYQVVFDVEGDGTFTLNLDRLAESRDIVEKNFPTTPKPPPNKTSAAGKNAISGPGKYSSLDSEAEMVDNYYEAIRVGNDKLAEVFRKQLFDIGVKQIPPPKEQVKSDYYALKAFGENNERKYVPVPGAKAVKLAYDGEYYIFKEGGDYRIHEARTGLSVMGDFKKAKNEKQAIEIANEYLKGKESKINEAIKIQIEKYGESPRYAKPEPPKEVAPEVPKPETIKTELPQTINEIVDVLYDPKDGITPQEVRRLKSKLGDLAEVAQSKNKKEKWGVLAVKGSVTNLESSIKSILFDINKLSKNKLTPEEFKDIAQKYAESKGDYLHKPLNNPIEEPPISLTTATSVQAADKLISRLKDLKDTNRQMDNLHTMGYRSHEVWNGLIDNLISIVESNRDVINKAAEAIDKFRKSDFYKSLTPKDKTDLENDLKGIQDDIGYPVETTPKSKPSEVKTEINPEDTSLKRAVADNEKAKREGVDAVDHMVSQLQDTSVENAMEAAKSAVDSGIRDAKSVTKDIIRTKKGTAEDEAILLYDRARMRNREIDLMKRIREADGTERDALSDELLRLYEQMADNDYASAIIGREASTIFRLRQKYIDSEYSLYSMEREYSASKGIDELSPEEKQYVKDQYQALKTAEAKVRELESTLAVEQQKLRDQEMINAIRMEGGRNKSYKPEYKNVKKRFNAIADVIEKGVISDDIMLSTIPFAKEAWNLGVKTAAGTVRLAGDVAQAVVDGLVKIRETKAYKDLSDEHKSKLEKKFTDHVKSLYYQTDNSLKTESKPKQKSGKAKAEPETTEGKIKIPTKLLKQLVEDGVDNIDDLVAAVKGEMWAELEGFTDREIRDAITNYGKIITMSKEQVDVQLRKIKRMGKLASGMEDVQQGQRPLRSGLQRDKPDVEERARRKELNDLIKELPMGEADLEKYQKSALDAIKTRLTNRIEELQHEIDTGEKKVRKERNIQLDAEAEELVRQRDELKKIHDEVFGKPELTDEQRIERALNGIDRAQKAVDKKIAENDLERKKTKQIDSPELTAAREALKQRKDVLNKMREEAGILQREYNERLLKAIKARQEKLQARLDARDFNPPVKINRARSQEVDEATAEYKKLQLKWKLEQQKEILKNRPGFEKFIDKSLKIWTGVGLLSGIKTLAKLAHYTAMEVFYGEPIDILTSGAAKLFLPGLAKKAYTEGQIDWASRKEFYKTLVSKQTYKEAWQYAKERNSYIDNLYGDVTRTLPEEFALNFGKLHGVEKYPLRKADFAKNYIRIENYYKREGYDVTDPSIRKIIGAMAYEKANYRIMMSKNFLSTTLRNAQTMMLHNKTAPTLGKIGYYVSKVLFPIISVPTNYTIRTARAWGGIGEFGVRVMKDGYGKMTPEQAESALLALKNGLPGLAIGMLVFNSNLIKVDDDGNLIVGGWKVPAYLTHHPHILVAKLYAEAKHIYEKKTKKAPKEKGNALYEAISSVPIETLQETPYLSERTIGMLDSPSRLKTYFQNLVISFTQPQLMKDVASFTDDTDKKRKPTTFVERWKMGVPGLRKSVPLDKKKKTGGTVVHLK